MFCDDGFDMFAGAGCGVRVVGVGSAGGYRCGVGACADGCSVDVGVSGVERVAAAGTCCGSGLCRGLGSFVVICCQCKDALPADIVLRDKRVEVG